MLLTLLFICFLQLLATSASPLENTQHLSQDSNLQLESPRISASVPLSPISSFATLLPDLLARVFSFTTDFPALSSVNRHYLATYQALRRYLLTERLGGFDPADNYRLVGSFIHYNYPKDLLALIELITADNRNSPSLIIRASIIAYNVALNFEPDEIALLLKNERLAKLLLESLAISQDFSTFARIFPLSPANFRDRNIVFGFIASNHHRLFPSLLAFIHRNHPVERHALAGFSSIFDYLKQLIIVSSSVEDLLDALQKFAQIRPRLFQSTFLDDFYLELMKTITTPHQSSLLHTILHFSQRILPIHLQMPLTILFAPQNWPLPGTWPQIFMQNEEDAHGEAIDYDAIIHTSLDLSIRFNHPTITHDINSHIPTDL